MALDDLQGVIEKLRKMIETQRRYLAENETRTRQVLIDPLLQELGWDVSNPNAVQLEYWVREQRADYALMSNGKPLAVIEAKRLGRDLDEVIKQAFNYANPDGIDYIIVTDGDKWEMYDVFKKATLEERLLMRLQLSQQPAHINALQALAMWKPKLASDDSLSAEVSADAEKRYSFASKQSYPPETRPIRLKIGDNIEKQVKLWQEVTQEVVVWLVDAGKLSGNDRRIEMGEWTFINSEAVNRDGTRFINPQPLPNGLFLDRGRGTPRKQWEILWKLLKQFNIDLSEIEVFYKLIGKASR